MILFICFFVILLIGIIFTCLYNKYDSFICLLIGVINDLIGSIGIIVILLISLTLQSDFDYTEAQYNNLKTQIEYVNKDDIVTAENLRNQVLEMNNTIDAHKIYNKNIFVGDFYSEKIGNLEKLQWKSN